VKPYYQDAAVTLYHGDCRVLLGPMGGVDHVITDPPFEAEAHTLQRRIQHEKDSAAEYGRVVVVEPLEFPPITAAERAFAASAFHCLARRWVLVFCQIEGAPLWRASGETAGLVYKRTCLWVKRDGMPQYSGDRPGMGYETFVAMHKPGRSRWNGGGKHGVYDVPKGADGALGSNEHPTQKPEKLMLQIVADFTDAGETILDAYCGSGTTLVAAKRLGRKAIGIEMNERFCEVAAKRLRQSALDMVYPPDPKPQSFLAAMGEPGEGLRGDPVVRDG
jgi:DNA modification methylase